MIVGPVPLRFLVRRRGGAFGWQGGGLLFPRVLVSLVGLNGGTAPHIGGCRRVQVRLHAVSPCVHLLTRLPQFTGQTRGRFTFGLAAA
jgi:hypothetical protein